ncbi:RIB43A-like with coiled-coils protein 2 [Biomphalaria glabrata]|uniref:RIB43A-like with coiled-coils protein 2 n=1 Tax=Biomphalaria glabrata TaxID=6526 RepID=A0A9U8DY17_BIOGL|nr:RIB43A-like with coiled-coils protein 2 [Biomphalaria glabrata]KAI8739501.1 RIB43A-like with coiled-coils protein 2 [Biomphalaria glabrata]KAI8771759.1 RIB43A with coiled-coils protein 2 [Biomphalaria glabrata]
MYKLDLPVDYKQAAAIERRRAMEEERKTRIFNAKVRQIGIDKQAIDQQIFDRKQMEDYERKRHEAFAADALRNDRIAVLLEKRQEQDIRALNEALNEFRALHQQPNQRREWDLYDPDGLKKDKPARVHDDDPRCGVASIQKFDGEDLNSKARKKLQNEQSRKWHEAQMRERERARRNQEEADRLYELKQRELDERAIQLQQAEEECRKAIDMATASYNDALKNEQRERERLKRQQEQDDNMTEIANHVFGDILTENPAVAQSAFGPHRVIPDRWKGMSPQQLEEIRKEQARQMAEAERLRQEEELRNREYDRQASANARAALLIEKELERKRKEIEKAQADENRRLAQEQKAHIDFLNKEVYTNSPTSAFFMQFNTSTR